MPTSSGPNTAADSNIIFSYDTADVINSYRGEPTTNLYTTLGFSFYQEEGGHSATRTTGAAPGLNLPTNYDYHTITTTSNWENESKRLIIWPNNSLTGSTAYHVSFWARVISKQTAQIGSAFYGNALNNTLNLTSQWQRFSFSSITNSTYRALEIGSKDGALVFQIAGLQIEAKSHVTSYVNGTRSATQGLVTLIGSASLDLSNVSFDSAAKITFDGTNDYIPVSLNTSLNVYCLELVWYNNNAIPNNDTVIGGPTTYQTPIEFNGNGTGVHLGAWTGGMTNEAIHIWGGGGATSNRVAAAVGYHHVVFNWNGITYDIWVDGVNTTTYYQNDTTPAGLITATSIKLGRDVDNYCFNGQIPITKIYNITLSAEQIKQNYQKYKSRFNLS